MRLMGCSAIEGTALVSRLLVGHTSKQTPLSAANSTAAGLCRA
jgi:hypothetical protein